MTRYPGSLRWPARAGLCCLAAVAVTAATIGAARISGAAQAASTPPACSQAQQQPSAGRTTVTTIGQAYYCILAHYYSGPVLDDRVLLAGAFAGLTRELGRLGIDQPDATMPALAGSRDSDWAAFAAVYSRVIGKVPAPDVQQAATAAMTGMVAALNDNHARWYYASPQPPGATPSDTYGLGINTSPAPGVAEYATGETLPPAVVASVDPRSPAARAGCEPVTSSPRSTARRRSPTGISLLACSTCSTSPTRSSKRYGSRSAGRSPAPLGPSRSPRPPTLPLPRP
jgi:carboxyl-terminal processing protease